MMNIRKDFPILLQKINGYPLVYVDSASTTQKPQQVLDALMHFYTTSNANVFRGMHVLGDRATQMYEDARAAAAQCIGARDVSEIVFTKGTTESINFVASTWGTQHIKHGDEIVVTELEHHSNVLPWQRLAQQSGAILKYIPVLADGMLDMQQMSSIITQKTKLVAVSHVSNALGTHNDIQSIITHAHTVGARVLVDGAQSVPHQKINVHELDCDFFAFSGHKMLAPTGIGVLYIKKELHESIPPYQLGGGMVFNATMQSASWLPAPHKFEAGTPPIAQAIGLHAAIKYIHTHIDFEDLRKHEAALCTQLIDALSRVQKIKLLGPIDQLKEKGHMVSFVIDGMHGHDVAAYLNNYGICVRAGHHCAQPLALKLSIDASVRVSFYIYNTSEEVARIINALHELL